MARDVVLFLGASPLVGGGIQDVRRYCDDAGFRLAVMDPALKERPTLAPWAHMHLYASILHPRQALQEVEEKGLLSHLAGVVAVGSESGHTAALLAEAARERRGKPNPHFNPYAQALALWDKDTLRDKRLRRFSPFGLRRDGWYVVKPALSRGSRGLSLLHRAAHPDMWRRAVERARQENVLAPPGRAVVIQPRVTGWEIASDWFIDGEEPRLANWALRFFHPTFGLEAGHINPVPPDMADDLLRIRMREAARRLCQVVGLRCGIFKMDVMVTLGRRVVILEATGRWSGGLDSCWSAMRRGMRLPAFQAHWSVTGEFDTCFLKGAPTFAGVYAPLPPEGDWKTVDLSHVPDDVHILYRNPDIRHPRSNAERFLFLGAVDTDPDRLWGRLLRAGLEVHYVGH